MEILIIVFGVALALIGVEMFFEEESPMPRLIVMLVATAFVVLSMYKLNKEEKKFVREKESIIGREIVLSIDTFSIVGYNDLSHTYLISNQIEIGEESINKFLIPLQ